MSYGKLSPNMPFKEEEAVANANKEIFVRKLAEMLTTGKIDYNNYYKIASNLLPRESVYAFTREGWEDEWFSKYAPTFVAEKENTQMGAEDKDAPAEEPLELDWCVECGDEPSKGAVCGNLCEKCGSRWRRLVGGDPETCPSCERETYVICDTCGDCEKCCDCQPCCLCQEVKLQSDLQQDDHGEDYCDYCWETRPAEEEEDEDEEGQYAFACCGAKGAFDPEDECSDCIMLPYKLKRICKEVFSPESEEELANLFTIAFESRWIDIKPYSHNIVGLTLRMLDEDQHYDEEKIKLVVKTFGLDKKGWDYLLGEEKEN